MWVWDRPHVQKLRLTVTMANFRCAEWLPVVHACVQSVDYIACELIASTLHSRQRPEPCSCCPPGPTLVLLCSIRLPALVALVATQIGLLSTSLSLPMLAPLLLGTGMLLRSIR